MLPSRATRVRKEDAAMPAVLVEKRNHIAYVTFNRPEVHNSFNPELLVLMGGFWEEAAESR